MREVFDEEFLGAENFLNTATYGLPSRRQTEALHAALRRWELGELGGPEFDASVAQAREAFARLVNMPAESVAMGGSASALIGLVAAAIPDGTRVATVPGEFASVTGPFAVQANRGVMVTELPLGELEARAGDFDLVAVSVVQSADGRMLDLDALRTSVEGRSTFVLLDVTQAAGWLELDLHWADAVVGAVYKWMLSPRGTAWMAVSSPLADHLVPHAANWYSSADAWSNTYAFPTNLAPDARRFDTSPAWFTVLGAGIAMPWLASLDMAAVEEHCVGLANQVRQAVGMVPSNSAIVALDVVDAAARLEAAGIRAAVRAGRVRVGFHLYNTAADAETLIRALGVDERCPRGR
ncbi:aminotransferase class V-fold PLP-dependent enzyme [Brevibacterium daeguense]|uniref:Aminotransferase class V-fold PLP-dependent enzyme n=1 Tax=Brevibacterium daeguense TaxID=909936 RepID=A0ABP8EFC0_9MICO|nr:aminotransferase class V-fold PLP-dependent enzyme [Brevibacterium daeguense]